MSITPTRRLLMVSVLHQQMALLLDGQIEATFTISTSKNPPSCIADSFGTPLGLHRLADKIGASAPSGTVFKGRQPLGHFSEFSPEAQQGNLITSRIIRIGGLEPGKNQGEGRDSYARYIYLHGTNHEDRIGQPFSGGCIELRNDDIIDLFPRVESGDLLWIY